MRSSPRKRLNVGDKWQGLKLFYRENGVSFASPMLVVIIALKHC